MKHQLLTRALPLTVLPHNGVVGSFMRSMRCGRTYPLKLPAAGCRVLLDAGANPDLPDDLGLEPMIVTLEHATETGQLELVRMLYPVRWPRTSPQRAPLHASCPSQPRRLALLWLVRRTILRISLTIVFWHPGRGALGSQTVTLATNHITWCQRGHVAVAS
jgi:hypothetical protein